MQLLGATCHQRRNSRPIHRLHGRGNGVQDLWMVPGQRGWMVVYGQLFDGFCWICFVFGKWFWVCLWPIPSSCMPIPSHLNCFHSFISTSFLCFDWKASSPHGVMVHSCAARLGMFVGETNLPVPWHQIHDSLRASTAASQDFLQGDG